ncbi:type II toxin-antitoxin system RelE/ParE family toxin [Nostoc sp. UHCC 0870]|uniref:type II toxin-antitoxin system RelE/ParE family toxin n=1 Tax=Nostoc sp. UHCC 0870 TaxID=2914041 RepID=UPI001EDF884B|nr:type II toxin-antitoxin system RelE/ParE family toxin [Nostoc sp. UHCC 0870]UKP01553.1 type II toxin-antitoxin system RelE/ParE family toxin [Nostoc sp. UHCC 0870]
MNPKPYVLSEQAEEDLARIYAYIARDNLDAAEQMLSKLLSACELLTDNPRIGEKVAKLLSAAMQRLKTLPREGFIKIFQLLP